MDLYIWNLVIDGKWPNGCLFGVGSLVGNYRPGGNRISFKRVTDGEGLSRLQQLTPQMMEIVRQLTLIEARHEAAECEAAINAQMEEMKKRQIEM